MFRVCVALAVLATLSPVVSAAPKLAGKETPLEPLVSGLKNPESVCIGPGGRVFVSVIGEFGKDGDGAVVEIKNGKVVPFCEGLNDPKGLVAWKDQLFVADNDRVVRIDAKGKSSVFVAAKDFPKPPRFLNDIEVDHMGNLYVSDSGDLKGKDGAIFKISRTAKKVKTDGKFALAFDLKVTTLADASTHKAIRTPNGLRVASEYHLHVLDFNSGELHRLSFNGKEMVKIADGFGGGDGITFDYHGRLYLTDWLGGKVHVIARPDGKPVLLASGFQSCADPCLSADGKSILVPDMKAGAVYSLPCTAPGSEVDESPLAIDIVPALADVEWTGWQPEDKRGKIVPQRPIVLTHAGDGSKRIFMATQHGVIHLIPDAKAKKSKLFLDIQERVSYNDNQNEEGFLGLAFHPNFKKNGEVYVYYTPRRMKSVNIISRFRVMKDDPERLDPASEEVLMVLNKPFWNHDGGTIVFGPDGYLYIAVGDGGLANDPFNHGQNLQSLLGKVLRIDVNAKGEGKQAYGIPRDNPFADGKTGKPEIWAYGFRNIWRMSFDSRTKELWAADVGQNLWEEINLVKKGGNYGWRKRESLHPFWTDGLEPNKDMIEPIWEYHHDVGKSITGGHVYRGKKTPELEGLYLYADYVTGHVWGLRYDEKKQRVTENRLLRQGGFPVFSFGEDEEGEVYLLTSSDKGKGIFTFRSKEGKNR